MNDTILNKKYALVFLIIYFLGFYFSKDFGITWDEDWHRLNGQDNLAYIAKTLNLNKILNLPESVKDNEKVFYGYGVIFDSVCGIIEHLLNLQDKASIFIMRHRVNFAFYMIGIYLFFLFLKSILKSANMAFICTMFLLLHPRLLAHGVFNSKDSIAQAILSCAFLPIFLFFRKNSLKYIIIAGIVCGLGVATRVPLLYLPSIFLLLIFSQNYTLNKKLSNSVIQFSCFVLSLIASIYLFWPSLWANPIGSIIHTFDRMSHFPWGGINYYMGNFIKANQIPWHYIPVWILITTPITFLIFFIIGIIQTLFKLYRNQAKYYWFQIFMIAGFVCPTVIIILIKSTLYDGWRHVFFIYPFLVYFMAVGFSASTNWIETKMMINRFRIIIILTAITFVPPVFSIIKIHPHQQVYFNYLAGKDPMEDFEGDYWGSSMRQGLEWIMKNDDRDSLTIISPEGIVATKNWAFLTKEKQKGFKYIKRRKDNDILKYQDLKNYKGDYYITNFRASDEYFLMKKKAEYPFENEVHAIKVYNMKILAIYDLKNMEN